MDVFGWNMLIYGVGFFLGVNFTHLDVGVMQNFVIDWTNIKSFPPFLWGVLIGLVVLVLAVSKVMITFYIEIHVFKYYLAAVAVGGVIFYLKARKATDVHIHHYNVGLAFTALLCKHDVMCIVLSGITNGVFIEGSTRYGYAAVFTYGPKAIGEALSPSEAKREAIRRNVSRSQIRAANQQLQLALDERNQTE